MAGALVLSYAGRAVLEAQPFADRAGDRTDHRTYRDEVAADSAHGEVGQVIGDVGLYGRPEC